MNKTQIEYLDYTWNPITMRCTPISEACVNCWHLKRANMLTKNPKISRLKQRIFAGETCPHLFRSELENPLVRLRKPSIIGVQFMGDLFHESVPFEFIDRIFAEMENAHWHTYIVLTKRPERMLEYHNYCEFENTDGSGNLETSSYEHPDHIWLGITVENQQRYEERIFYLLQIPAAIRFISVEPMLGSINLDGCLTKPGFGNPDKNNMRPFEITNRNDLINWVICGAETGPGARMMAFHWARDLYGQCKSAGVPFFFKKMSKGGSGNGIVENTREFPATQ